MKEVEGRNTERRKGWKKRVRGRGEKGREREAGRKGKDGGKGKTASYYIKTFCNSKWFCLSVWCYCNVCAFGIAIR